MYKELSKPLNEMTLVDMQAQRSLAETANDLISARAWDLVITIYLTTPIEHKFCPMAAECFQYLLNAIKRDGQ